MRRRNGRGRKEDRKMEERNKNDIGEGTWTKGRRKMEKGKKNG